jgi:hypothetical protein
VEPKLLTVARSASDLVRQLAAVLAIVGGEPVLEEPPEQHLECISQLATEQSFESLGEISGGALPVVGFERGILRLP